MSLTGAYEKDGERVVGGSVRSDGSVRPIAKVRPGYLAKEDAPKYKPRGARERDAKLGIATTTGPATATGPVARVDDDDSKSAIKARIQAMKAEFERKKREKEGQTQTQTQREVEEVKEKATAKIVKEEGTDLDVSDLSESLGSLDIKPTTKTDPDTVTKSAPNKLQSRHGKKEVSDSTPKPSTPKPTTNVTPQKTPLKSRHAKSKETADCATEKSTDKPSATTTSGYVPPHKRK